MSKMATFNYWIELKKLSKTNQTAADLVKQIEDNKDDSELKARAKDWVIGFAQDNKIITTDPDNPKPSDVPDEDETPKVDPWADLDQAGLKIAKDKIKSDIEALKLTELKKPTWQQRQELRMRLKSLYYDLREVTNRITMNTAIAHKKAKVVTISNATIKKNDIIKAIRLGKSLSTIVFTMNLVSIDELVELITEEVIAECEKYRKDFAKYWRDWKKKFIPKVKNA